MVTDLNYGHRVLRLKLMRKFYNSYRDIVLIHEISETVFRNSGGISDTLSRELVLLLDTPTK